MLIDSHCHLDPAYLPAGASDVLARARGAGVGAFVCIGVGSDLAAARAAVLLASERTDVFAAVGVHPHDAAVLDEPMWQELSSLVRHPRVVAVGEIGLDYHYEHSPRGVQGHVFRRLIGLAREVQKPIVVHTREAPADTLAILTEEGARDVGGIIHCFSEDQAFAQRALDIDFDLSFSGILTFPSAHAIRAVARTLPSDRILVETDSPYLAPVPLRGKKCEPSYIVHTARKLAEIRAVPLEAIASVTTANAVRRLSLAGVTGTAQD
jgi:TatD DNase family protein